MELIIRTNLINSEFHFNTQKVSLEILTTNYEIENFREEWFNFWKNNHYRTPFNSPGWLIPWIKYFGNEQLYILVFRSFSFVVGCIPLYIFNAGDEQRYLKIIGTGNSDYLDLLIDPRYLEEILNYTLQFINEIKDRYDICEIEGQRQDSLLLKYIQSTSGIKYEMLGEDVAPVLQLSSDFESYIKTLPVQFRKNTHRAERKFSSWNYSLIKAAREEIPDVLDKLVTLHNAEWSFRNERGVLHDNTVLKFLSDVVEDGVENNTMSLYALRKDSEYAAVNLIFNTSDIAYFYIGAFNPVMQKYSPGSVILWKIIYECINNGITCFDFLKGGESYKYIWGAEDIKVYGIILPKNP